jgi:GAF domain-containing protein
MTTPDDTTIGQFNAKPDGRGLGKIWNGLTRPADSVRTLEGQRQARLLATLLLALALLTSVGMLSVILSGSAVGTGFTAQLILATLFAVGYIISRTKHYYWAAILSVTAIAILPSATFASGDDFSYVNTANSLIWTLFALLVGNIFFSARGVAILLGAILLSLGSLPLIEPAITYQNLFAVMSLDFVAGAIALINKYHRNQLELDRRTELTRANIELQALSTHLEARITDRTRDLALAAEVGHAISGVRDRQLLLADAAEMIQARFNLYHVQIYLSDAPESGLILQAGTGAIFEELISQGHRVQFGPGSINGLAAANREAIVVSNTANSTLFRPNPWLPETRSEISVPLISSDRVVGVLDLQSSDADGLTKDDLPAFEALAAQLAVAIENANLFTEVTRARADLEDRASDQARVAWHDFMDAINRREWLGYVRDESSTMPLSAPFGEAVGDHRLTEPIAVRGEAVGAIRLERAPEQGWTDDETEMVSLVARQVAQKVENLRLLAEAEQYRREAEESARRLIREGWQAYLGSSGDSTLGFVYDQEKVIPIASEADDEEAHRKINYTVSAGDETIGHLTVSDVSGDETEAAELVTAVAERLSAHLENLRLSEQTEQALAATEKQAQRLAQLNAMSDALNRTPSFEDVFNVAIEHIDSLLSSDRTSLTMITPDGESVEIAAVLGDVVDVSVGDQFLIDERATFRTAIRKNRVVIVPERASADPGGIRSIIVAPLVGEKGPIGTINVGSRIPNKYGASDKNLLMQIAAILGSTIERRRLAEQTRERANREQVLRQITTRVHAAVDAQAILRTAAQEVNRALGLETFVYLGDSGEIKPGNGQK